MIDKRLSWRTYGDGTALKVCSICLPTPHGRMSGVPIAEPNARVRQKDTKCVICRFVHIFSAGGNDYTFIEFP